MDMGALKTTSPNMQDHDVTDLPFAAERQGVAAQFAQEFSGT